MKKISAMVMLTAMLMLSAAALATAASAQDDVQGQDDAYPPNGEPEDGVGVDVEGAVEVNVGTELAFTGSSTGQTVKLAFGFVLVGAALVFVAKSRTRDDATV